MCKDRKEPSITLNSNPASSLVNTRQWLEKGGGPLTEFPNSCDIGGDIGVLENKDTHESELKSKKQTLPSNFFSTMPIKGAALRGNGHDP